MKSLLTINLLCVVFFLSLDIKAQEAGGEKGEAARGEKVPQAASENVPGLTDIIIKEDTASYIPKYRYRQYGLSYRRTKDEALSPLLFQGPGLSYTAITWKYNKQWLWQSEFNSRAYLLQNEPGSSVITEIGYSYQIAALREINAWQKNNWRFWAGPEAGSFLNIRMHSRNVNNIASYDWATTLGAAAMLSNEFQLWGRSFAFSNQVHLPVAFLYARPAYAWGVPPGIYEEQKGGWREAFQAATLNNMLLVSNRMNFDFLLRKRKNGKLIKYRAYRVSYTWDYFQIKTRNPLQSGGHNLSFSRIITF